MYNTIIVMSVRFISISTSYHVNGTHFFHNVVSPSGSSIDSSHEPSEVVPLNRSSFLKMSE